MPFNMAVAGVSGRRIILASLTVEDLALAYDVEAQLASQFPLLAPSLAGDVIGLTLEGVDFVAASAGGYVIDANGLHDDALFILSIDSSTNIYAKGGAGGVGGQGERDLEPPATDLSTVGLVGNNGGTAIRFGCETQIKGAGGLITKGYGAGGGGGGSGSSGNVGGGGGGGGGAALGSGGTGGAGIPPSDGNGTDGTVATNTANGTGGAGADSAGTGGDGGDSGGAATAGGAGSKAGGATGSDGNAIDSQGFTHSIDGAITVTGAII